MILLKRFKVYGHSMEPLIKNGEQVLISGINYLFKKPQVNDIVAFRVKGNKIFIKRLTRIFKDKYFVEGDNINDSFDSKNFGGILQNQIIGKVITKL